MTQQTMDCPEARLSLGVYVLGAIDPAERSQVDSHLASCRDCRDELAGLAGLPALLARVGVEEAIALAESDGPPPAEDEEQPPPRELLGTVLDLASARRRRRRWVEVGLSVAAALIIAAGVFGGLRFHSGAPSASSAVAVGPASGPWETETGHTADMSATVMYRPMGWGTQLAAKVTGIPVGTTCQIWVVGPGGKRMLIGSWVTDNNEGHVWYPLSAAVSSANVREFVITVSQARSITVPALARPV
jgi:predicted anti-sigma-YlaC factor YlaD